MFKAFSVKEHLLFWISVLLTYPVLILLGSSLINAYINLAGGVLTNGLPLYLSFLIFMLILNFFAFKRNYKFAILERALIWCVFPAVMLYSFSGNTLFVEYIIFQYFCFEILAAVNSYLQKKLNKCIKIKEFKVLVVSMILFCLIILFSSIDYCDLKETKKEDISEMQVLMLQDAVDTPADIKSSEEIKEMIRGYMIGLYSCRSYSISILNEPHLLWDEATNKYFYSAYVYGKEFFGANHEYGMLLHADTGLWCYAEDISVNK